VPHRGRAGRVEEQDDGGAQITDGAQHDGGDVILRGADGLDRVGQLECECSGHFQVDHAAQHAGKRRRGRP
jgi:hypothetical protein